VPILGPKIASSIQAAMTAAGNTGVNVPALALALGNGAAQTLVLKSFQTADTGTQPGVGIGTGIGIQGVSASLVSQSIQAAFLQEFGSLGPSIPGIAEAISQALEQELATATLTSNHSPCFVGQGTILPGSILITSSEWGSTTLAAGPTFLGSDWPRFANAVGRGCAQCFTTATGQVTITGSPTSPTTTPYSGPNLIQPAGFIS